jgi:hypothetical protein
MQYQKTTKGQSCKSGGESHEHDQQGQEEADGVILNNSNPPCGIIPELKSCGFRQQHPTRPNSNNKQHPQALQKEF